jgi:hypothetical protein
MRIILLASVLLLTCFAATDAALAAWKTEQGVEPPSYAWVEPATTNLNIDTVVVTCEEGRNGAILQLQLYLLDDGPLRPRGAAPEQLKSIPQAEISVDGRRFPIGLFFADEYVVLADSRDGPYPMLSDALLDALQAGKTMTIRFDLVAEKPGQAPTQAPTFGGEAVVDLDRSGQDAIAAVRRFANAQHLHRVGVNFVPR